MVLSCSAKNWIPVAGSNSQLETAVERPGGGGVLFKGITGDLAIVGAENRPLLWQRTVPKNVICRRARWSWEYGLQKMGFPLCYGCHSGCAGVCPKVWVASSRYPKHWLTVGDPAREFTMTQSAPLMVLPDPDEFVVVQVK